MSDSFLKKVLPKLGILCFEYHPEGYFSCVGESPHWAMELFPCVRNRFPQILPGDISPFLENFIIDAEEFWQQNNGAIMRSGYWTESIQTSQKTPQVQGSEVHLEALVLTLDGTFLLLLEVSEVKFFETFHWLQTAREDRLDSMFELKESASQTMSASLFDGLTGLPNEQAFCIQISQGLESLRREPTQKLLLLQLSMDGFQSINATLGKAWGNQCLSQLAKRLKGYCQVDDIVARLSANSFGLLINHPETISEDIFVQQLIASLRSPYPFKSQQIYATHSIGLLRIDSPQQTVEAAMENISLALEQAQSYGRDQYCIYNQALRDRQVQKITLKQTFLEAISRQTLVVEYRPIFSHLANKFVGIEPIVEWPQSDYYSSHRLRTLAHENGLDAQLATYEIESCLTITRQDEFVSPSTSKHPFVVFIHCFPQALLDHSYQKALTKLRQQSPGNVVIILKLCGLSPLIALDDLQQSLTILTALKIQLCLSLNHLDGVSQLKDWSESIHILSVDPGRQNLDMGPKRMAHPDLRDLKSNKHKILAEQVNHHSHAPIIADLNIDLCCGDFFSEPLPLSEFISLLQSQQ